MTTHLDKTIVFICCTIHMVLLFPTLNYICVLGFLITISISCLCSYLNPEYLNVFHFHDSPFFYGLPVIFLILCFIHPVFCIFLPIFLYDMLCTKNIFFCALPFVVGIYCISLQNFSHLIIWLATMGFSILLHFQSLQILHLHK